MRSIRLWTVVATAVLVSVANSADLVPIGSNWKYLNPLSLDASPSKGNFDTTWFTPGFDDSAWDGPAPDPFVRADSLDDPGINAFKPGNRNFIRPAATALGIPPSRERLTAYFRQEFTTASDATDLALEILADDGARVYLDGNEIYSLRCCRNDDGPVPPGTPTTFTDLALRIATNVEDSYTVAPVMFGETLKAGTHTLAVAVHQNSNRSSDMGFSLRMFDGYIYRPFITPGSEWSYFEGEEEPSETPLAWTTVDFDDSRWSKGNDGFGYDTNDTDNVLPMLQTELDMQGIYSSLYIRRGFTVDDVSEIGKLELSIDYDDAFVAYINGTEVVRQGAPGDVGAPVPFDAFGANHESTNADGSPAPMFTISLSDFPDLLNQGANNVLAIQGLNQALDSSDFLLGRIGLAGLAADKVAPTGDFDNNGVLDAADIDALTLAVREGQNPPEFDLNSDGLVNNEDRLVWINDIKNTYVGDSNLDGEFGSTDFVTVFRAGQYEDDIPGNSTWATGDWDGDGDFGTRDFVAAFSAGGYEKGPKPGGPNVAVVPEPNGLVLLLIGVGCLVRRRR